MGTTVEQALAIALINPQIHSVLVSGLTGVGKSYTIRKILEKWQVPYRTLPVHIQEEALRSRINLEETLKQGKRVTEAGVFDSGAQCFFVDDFHLVRPAVRQQIERIVKDQGCTLLGTINSEEGMLAAYEWEAIDLHVAIETLDESQRVAVLQAVKEKIQESVAIDMMDSKNDYNQEIGITVEALQNAQRVLSLIQVSDAMLHLCVQYINQAGCSGNKNESLLWETARAIAALESKDYVLPRHIELAALYVLPHRMHQSTESNNSSSDSDVNEENISDFNDDSTSTNDNLDDSRDSNNNDSFSTDNNQQIMDDEINRNESVESIEEERINENVLAESYKEFNNSHDENIESFNDNSLSNQLVPEQLAALSQSLLGLRLANDNRMDRKVRRGSGKRLRTKTSEQGGRYVKSIQHPKALEDLALDATIRAAAPYQKIRQLSNQGSINEEMCKKDSLAIQITPSDYRRKEREKEIGGHYLFVVDASGSMAARKRMEAVKGAIVSLLQDAYEKRDKVGLVVFRKESAELVLPFTGSIDLAKKLLERLPTGGKTPLAAGLEVAYNTCSQLLRRNPFEQVDVLLITDGRATYGVTNNPVKEALDWGRALGELPIGTLILDTEHDFIRLGVAKELMKVMHSTYYSLDNISADTVLEVLKGALKS